MLVAFLLWRIFTQRAKSKLEGRALRALLVKHLNLEGRAPRALLLRRFSKGRASARAARFAVLLGIFMLFFSTHTLAADPVWNAFAGQEHLIVRGIPDVNPGTNIWFSVMKDQRKISSGSCRAEADASLNLPVHLPEMKPGVALALDLTLRAGGERGRVLRDGTLWAFAERPVEPNHNPAASRDILLFDPDGKTEAALCSIEIPFEWLKNLETLSNRTNAVVVVAEGVSLESERGLWSALLAAVAHGNHVLLLAPKDGQLRPSAEWGGLAAGSVQDVLRRTATPALPYKLDLVSWCAAAKTAKSFFPLGHDSTNLTPCSINCFIVSRSPLITAISKMLFPQLDVAFKSIFWSMRSVIKLEIDPSSPFS